MRKINFRGSVPFDPLYIILQITSLQFLFYFSYTLLCLFSDFCFNLHFTRDQVYGYRYFSFTSKIGLLTVASYLLSFIATAFAFSFIVEKMTKALDFMSSTFIIHLVVVICYSGFPVNVVWWVVSIVGLGLSVFIGILASIPKESVQIDEAFLMGQSV